MSIWTVILIIAVIAAIILGVLYFVGRKMQAKQEDQRAQLDQMAQTVNMLVIDKKRMKIMDAGCPKMVTDNIPKRARLSKVPVVKAKIGPKITPLLCDCLLYTSVTGSTSTLLDAGTCLIHTKISVSYTHLIHLLPDGLII